MTTCFKRNYFKVLFRIWIKFIFNFLDGIFIFDIFFQCFCGYHDSGGQRFPILTIREVVRNYLRTWFLIDLIAAIPFDRFFADSDDGHALIRIPGLIKTVRLLKLRRIMRKWNALSYGPLLKVCTILFAWLLAAHWVACGFFIIGWYSCQSLYEETWVTKHFPPMKADCSSGARPSVYELEWDLVTELSGNGTQVPAFPNGVTFFTVHVRCLYWAMATMSSMGYGRAPTAFTDLEYMYAIIAQVIRPLLSLLAPSSTQPSALPPCLLGGRRDDSSRSSYLPAPSHTRVPCSPTIQVWGACLAAAIFSNIGQMLNKTDQSTQRYQIQLDKVREFGKLYKLPKELRAKLSGYNELLFAVSRGYDTSAIAAMFPQVWLCS